jgi:hypothetical protein
VEQRLLDEFKAAQMWESMLVEIPVEFSPVEPDHLGGKDLVEVSHVATAPAPSYGSY